MCRISDARPSGADSEPLHSLQGRFLLHHLRDVGEGRPLEESLVENLEVFLFSLGEDLHAIVVDVSHPAAEIVLLGGPIGEESESYALNPAPTV